MLKLKGLGVSTGVATAPVLLFNIFQESELHEVPEENFNELFRFEKAFQRTKADIAASYNRLTRQGIREGEIFGAYLLILDDEEFTGTIRAMISNKNMGAREAVEETVKKISTMLRETKSEYISSRTKDIDDLGNQLIRNMVSKEETIVSAGRPSIIVAKDLKVSDVAKLDKSTILGIIIEEGSPISHVSILARALKIPAVIKCQNIVNQVEDRDIVYINGSTGEVIINP